MDEIKVGDVVALKSGLKQNTTLLYTVESIYKGEATIVGYNKDFELVKYKVQPVVLAKS